MNNLLLTNARVLTFDDRFTQYSPGYVAVAGSSISGAGPMDSAPQPGADTEVIDCGGCVVMPGLINCHTHLPMVYFRGMADDLPLMEWLEKHIWPVERKCLNPEFVYEATTFACAELIKGGVTCVNDMYLFASDVARAVSDAGMRGYIGEGVVDAPTASAASWHDGLKLARMLFDEYKGHHLITVTACAHAPYSCSVELLQAVHGMARENDALFHIHLHESELEGLQIPWALEDESPAHALQRIGVLGPKLLAAHCVWIDDHDIHHMSEHGCAVAHCPTSNLKLGNGVAPVHSMLEQDMPVGVGTDGAASNNNLDMWEEIHLAALVAKGAYKDPAVVPARTALSFATSSAARALGADHIGTVEQGKRADLIVVDLRQLNVAPLYPGEDAIYSCLAYNIGAQAVRDTIVDGRILMRDRQLTGIDEEKVRAQAQDWVNREFGG